MTHNHSLGDQAKSSNSNKHCVLEHLLRPHRDGVPADQWPIQPVNITGVGLEMLSMAGPWIETY